MIPKKEKLQNRAERNQRNKWTMVYTMFIHWKSQRYKDVNSP